MRRELTAEMRENLRIAAEEMGIVPKNDWDGAKYHLLRIDYAYLFGRESALAFKFSNGKTVRDVIYYALLIQGVTSGQLHIDQRPIEHKEIA